MKKSNFFLMFICFVVSIIGYSQNAQEIINDLKKDLQSNPDDKKRAIIYSDIGFYYANISVDSATHYCQKAILEKNIQKTVNLHLQMRVNKK